jgi:hypothetical protein
MVVGVWLKGLRVYGLKGFWVTWGEVRDERFSICLCERIIIRIIEVFVRIRKTILFLCAETTTF